jgi:hypothetical protein
MMEDGKRMEKRGEGCVRSRKWNYEGVEGGEY